MERGILAAEKPRKKTEEQDEAKRKEGPRAAVIRMNLVPSGDNSTVDGEVTMSTSSSTSTLSSGQQISEAENGDDTTSSAHSRQHLLPTASGHETIHGPATMQQQKVSPSTEAHPSEQVTRSSIRRRAADDKNDSTPGNFFSFN